MSGAASNWAWKQRIPSSAKFVLVAMADQVSTDLAFMSSKWLCEATGQDRKTVLANLSRLVQWKLIEDTGERRGRTGQIPVYRLLIGEGLFDNAPHSKGTGNGTGTKSGTVPKTDGKSTVFPSEQSQKRDTDPKDPKDPTPRSPRARTGEDETGNGDFGAVTFHPSPVSEAASAMIEAGMPAVRINHSHPALTEALDAGVTPQELADITREYLGRGQGPPSMVYVLRTATGRRNDVQSRKGEPENATRVSRNQQGSRASAVDKVANFIRERQARAGGGGRDDDDPGVAAAG